VEADQLEVAGLERANRRLRGEIALLHEPGPESGTGEHGGEHGCGE
jgi:hypothetical protein